MKKKILVLIAFFALAVVEGAAEDHYYNNGNYSGYASISYIGKNKEIDIVNDFDQVFGFAKYYDTIIIEKLSNKDSFLINSALDEYDCKKGEVYAVWISDEYENNSKLFLIEIGNKDSYYWVGATVIGLNPFRRKE